MTNIPLCDQKIQCPERACKANPCRGLRTKLCVVDDDGLGHPAILLRACDNVDDGRKGDKMYHGVRLRLYVVGYPPTSTVYGYALAMTPHEAIRLVCEQMERQGAGVHSPAGLEAAPASLCVEGMPSDY